MSSSQKYWHKKESIKPRIKVSTFNSIKQRREEVEAAVRMAEKDFQKKKK